jgi:hypothetical protein
LTIIEDLIDQEAAAHISKIFGIEGNPSKPEIKRFFQERLASDQVESLGPGFEAKGRALVDALKARISD